MQVLLNVDVHLVAGNDGSLGLLIGSFFLPVKDSRIIAQVLRGEPLKKQPVDGRRRARFVGDTSSPFPPISSKKKASKTVKHKNKQVTASQKAYEQRKARAAERIARGECIACGKKVVAGKKYCRTHYDLLLKNIAKARKHIKRKK